MALAKIMRSHPNFSKQINLFPLARYSLDGKNFSYEKPFSGTSMPCARALVRKLLIDMTNG